MNISPDDSKLKLMSASFVFSPLRRKSKPEFLNHPSHDVIRMSSIFLSLFRLDFVTVFSLAKTTAFVDLNTLFFIPNGKNMINIRTISHMIDYTKMHLLFSQS